jgi:uncharacterized protein
MEFTNEFRVPSDVETTFATLTDLERVAPCLPGATLEEVDGDTYTGSVKVKVGPVTVAYRGTARLTEVDAVAKRGRIEAAGKETKGAGTASADVVATMEADGDGTLVKVVTDLNITGKPAQFGRGVMAEVGNKIIGQFATRLREMIEADEAATVPVTASGLAPEDTVIDGPAAAAQEAPTGPRKIEAPAGRDDDVLDLMEVAGTAAAKRLIPLVIGVAVVVGIVWWRVTR